LEQLTKEFSELASQLVEQKDNIVILTHKNPDGDAIGSGLALYHYFKEKGKSVVFIVPNQLPTYLMWMPGIHEVKVFETNPAEGTAQIENAALLFMVDFNHQSRLSDVAVPVIKSKAPKILIDHHPDPQDLADLIYSRTSASSTGEMVYEFLEMISGKTIFSKPVAESLYVGIMTDTGSFSYNSSEPLTFKVVENLLKSGIDKDAITDKVYNNFSEHRLRFLGYALNQGMRVKQEYGTAYLIITKADMEKYHYEQGDTEGFVNFPLSVRGIEFSAIFIEKDHVTKCSFRSKGNFPANLVASEHFKGGGHMNAAGGELPISLADAVAKFEEVLPMYQKYLNQNVHE